MNFKTQMQFLQLQTNCLLIRTRANRGSENFNRGNRLLMKWNFPDLSLRAWFPRKHTMPKQNKKYVGKYYTILYM